MKALLAGIIGILGIVVQIGIPILIIMVLWNTYDNIKEIKDEVKKQTEILEAQTETLKKLQESHRP